jgi:5-hydroxyisourate hydrolase
MQNNRRLFQNFLERYIRRPPAWPQPPVRSGSPPTDRRQEIGAMAGRNTAQAEGGYLTTHVLDTARGIPARGIPVTVDRLAPDGTRTRVAKAVTNEDGRTDAPLLSEGELVPGCYEIVFDCAEYLQVCAKNCVNDAEMDFFLREIPVRFAFSGANGDKSHLHVPLLLSPFGYSTYRGS